MNILIVMGIAAFALCLLWAAQSVALKIAGQPLTGPLRYETRVPVVVWTGRAMIQITFLIILVGTPLALGISPLAALHRAFPLPVPWRNIAIGFSVMFFPFVIAMALYVRAGWVRIVPQFNQQTRRAKLFRRFLTPLPLATVEEAVFRGTILEQLLQSLPQSFGFSVLAVIVSALIFSSVHFIRRQPEGKPVWRQSYGFFLAGCLLGVAYIVGGRNLWVPIPMHAAAIVVIEISRLYSEYHGPRWLVGFAESPYSGVLGTLGIAGMAIALVVLI